DQSFRPAEVDDYVDLAFARPVAEADRRDVAENRLARPCRRRGHDSAHEFETLVVAHEVQQRETHPAGSAADGETDGTGHEVTRDQKSFTPSMKVVERGVCFAASSPTKVASSCWSRSRCSFVRRTGVSTTTVQMRSPVRPPRTDFTPRPRRRNC